MSRKGGARSWCGKSWTVSAGWTQEGAALTGRFEEFLADLFEDRLLSWTLAYAGALAYVMEAKWGWGEPFGACLPDSMLVALRLPVG